MTGPLTRIAAITASLLVAFAAGGVEARQDRYTKRHHVAPRARATPNGVLVTAGSDIRITGVGEVIVPPISIVVVNTTPPNRRGPDQAPPNGASGQK